MRSKCFGQQTCGKELVTEDMWRRQKKEQDTAAARRGHIMRGWDDKRAGRQQVGSDGMQGRRRGLNALQCSCPFM